MRTKRFRSEKITHVDCILNLQPYLSSASPLPSSPSPPPSPHLPTSPGGTARQSRRPSARPTQRAPRSLTWQAPSHCWQGTGETGEEEGVESMFTRTHLQIMWTYTYERISYTHTHTHTHTHTACQLLHLTSEEEHWRKESILIASYCCQKDWHKRQYVNHGY